MNRHLHKIIRPGSAQARRHKLTEVMPLLEQAYTNGWRWSEILEMAREMMGEPTIKLFALKSIRRR